MKRTLKLKKLLAQAAEEIDIMYEIDRARSERRQRRTEQKLNILKDLIEKGNPKK